MRKYYDYKVISNGPFPGRLMINNGQIMPGGKDKNSSSI